MGPRFVIIKKGEHGALLCSAGVCAALPGYPTAEVTDPTGAGDSFAGGFMGAIVKSRDTSAEGLKRAMGYGTVVASLTVEGLGTSRLEGAAGAEVEDRLGEYRRMLAL